MTYAIDAPADVRAGRHLAVARRAWPSTSTRRAAALHLRSPLVGRPNVYNILAAAATAVALDLPFSAIEQGIAALSNVPGPVPGRLTSPTDDVRVVVDYAHTDDALKNLLETARPLAAGRVITVFGCGGDRDRTKRPLMGAVAARLSDLVIVTSDNPRSEDPARIIEEIKRGIVMPADRGAARGSRCRSRRRACAIVDRQAAIEKAIQEARPGDLVLVAGKGHEKTQVIGERTLPFDDVDVARKALGAPPRPDAGVVARGNRDLDGRPGGDRVRRRAAAGQPVSADRTRVDRLAQPCRRGLLRRHPRRAVRRPPVRRRRRSPAARPGPWSIRCRRT